jgi:formyl-CoA transferase/CoA:oxalate CoA-transferase
VEAALEGIKVIDITENLAGPLCSMILGDMGAEVIKIERRETGDNIRGWGPFTNGFSLAFSMVNRNKKSVTVNLKHPEAKQIIKRLAAQADIFFENYRPGTMHDLGLGYEDLREVNDRLIYCSVSGFGQTGPYKDRAGVDAVAQAMSGLMSVTGEPDGNPVKAGYPVTDLGTAMYATIGILLALQARARTGRGQHVDCSLFETGVSWSVWHAAKYLGTGEIPERQGSGHPFSVPYQAFATSDGYVMVSGSSQSLFRRLTELMGMPELADDPRFNTQDKRSQNREELIPILSDCFRTRTMDEWFACMDAAGIPCGPINTLDRTLSDPQAIARNMVVEVDHPIAGRIVNIGSPIKLSDTPAAFRTPAPSLGQHTEEILCGLGYSPDEITQLKQTSAV